MEIPSTETAAMVPSLQLRPPLHRFLRLSSAAQITVTTRHHFQLQLCPHHPQLRLFLRLHLHFHL